MRYENIYSSFPCPASGHFSAASSRVAPISACVFLQRVSDNLFTGELLKRKVLIHKKLNKNHAKVCAVSSHSTFYVKCLHSALLYEILLIVNELCSVDNPNFYMHYHLHYLHFHLQSSCTFCTVSYAQVWNVLRQQVLTA